jgi:hypothetical protein
VVSKLASTQQVAACSVPFSFLPGPLEGGVNPSAEIPDDLKTEVTSSLEEPELTATSFAILVNSALIFRVNASLAQVAAEGLRRVKYQLRQTKWKNEAFGLLSGLATVASVTRNEDLAQEVRTLMRIVRRKEATSISRDNALRIALIAAATHLDVAKWCKFVGDCMLEFAYEDASFDAASTLQHNMRTLCQLEPRLRVTLGRADAVISALVNSFASSRS